MLRIQTRLSDRYTAASELELQQRIAAAKNSLGSKVFILGHHYQRDEVIRWADSTGDSFKLSLEAQSHPEAEFIIFCGVHFMAETADIMTSATQKVVLPDLNAGCSMADMADIEEVEECWQLLSEVTDISQVIPVTYMNSSAAIKAFIGTHGGAVCTSSNADKIVKWALQLGSKVLFIPDQHLGRNTAYQLGFTAEQVKVWNPKQTLGGLAPEHISEAAFLVWKGHCSIHQRFTPEQIASFRSDHPTGKVVVHPECPANVITEADSVGSTEHIIQYVEEAPAGSVIGVGTEIHLVNRLNSQHGNKSVLTLDPIVCPCSTMFRITSAHLCWIMEGLVERKIRNQISVDNATASEALIGLQKMVEVAQTT